MQTAVVTGTAKGIGLGIIKKLLDKDYYVISIDKELLKLKHPNLMHHPVDVNNHEQIDIVVKSMKNIDLLINNSAIQIEKPYIEQSVEEITSVLNTNLVSLMLLTRKLLPKMTTNSHILNIGSVHSTKVRKLKIPYDVTKAGLDMFTKSLALELAPKIRVNSLNIGAAKTPMNNNFKDDEKLKESIERIPLKHILTPDEVSEVVLSLISDTFKYMTGSIIIYDGGRSLK